MTTQSPERTALPQRLLDTATGILASMSGNPVLALATRRGIRAERRVRGLLDLRPEWWRVVWGLASDRDLMVLSERVSALSARVREIEHAQGSAAKAGTE
jgi:hypothetical protein